LPLPMGHGLIDFSRSDTLWTSLQEIDGGDRVRTLEFLIPPLRQALYRLDAAATAKGSSGADTLLSATRFYSVRGPGFPRPVTYAELLAAATYIATQKEASAFRAAKTPAEQRKEFEAFWLACAGDPQKASALIKKYYARVEEANRLFTTTREGWKTDRGMLYCVLGPPASTLNHLDTQTWYYDLTGNAQENPFFFKRIVREGDGLTVEDYVLYRMASVENFWTRMVARWRSGEPL
ncbi:MAG TPA: GWxTD domain-containing protein, partial [Bacteroidota bacterium]|nr:GWxTD domain-containing protein [Bacteroidota bacterium]